MSASYIRPVLRKITCSPFISHPVNHLLPEQRGQERTLVCSRHRKTTENNSRMLDIFDL